LFLVTLFVQPVQIATEVLNEAQNAIAGWRRVLDILDVAPDVADPGDSGRDLPAGAIDVRFEHVHFAYPGGPEVLTDVDFAIAARSRVAVVGETGSGKTTFAKLLTRLMDPPTGQVRLSGVPLTEVRFASLRQRVVMVPQDGFLFDAYVADPDLLVLDEATSAVDPATEVRLQRTLVAVTRGRTTIAIAHRLSTAQAADEVIVVDRGRVVQRGPHADLVTDTDSVYARLYASW